MEAPQNRVATSKLLGVGLMSASVLLVELGITRLFSVITWSHFAFLAVSLALFGLSTSAVFLHVTARRHPREGLARQFWGYAIAFAVLTAVMGFVFLRTKAGTAFTSRGMLALTGVYLLASAPFFAGGACLALAVSRLHGDINRVYGADLAGAALGCLLFIPALDLFGGPGPLIGASALGSLGALCFTDSRPRRLVAGALAAVAATLLLVHGFHSFLDVRYTKVGERPFIFTKWNSHSRVAVYPETHHDWGLSTSYQGAHPNSLFMDIDASASTPILVARGTSDVSYLEYEVTTFGYRLLPRGGETLVIGPGGGRDVWSGLLFGARHVTGVEINSIIVEDVMRDRFADQSGNLYDRPDVAIFVDDGRNFVARSRDRYDLIQASLVDTWAATAAGAYSLTENNLYTVEAFVEYLSHLKPNGILSLSRWSPEVIRVLALARAACERMGWSFADRLFLVESHPSNPEDVPVATVILKTTPLSAEENERLRADAAKLGFPVLYAPARPGGAPEGKPEFVALATTADVDAFYRGIDHDVSPVYDDRPFFFHSTKRSDLPRVLRSAPFSDATDGLSIMVRLLYVAVGLVAAFIILPLLLQRRSQSAGREIGLGRLVYFGCLGVGFMAIEIGLMQRFVLFLGHPVYALTVVLFTLLLGGATGSAVSRRVFENPRRVVLLALPVIVIAAVTYAYLLPHAFASWLGFSRPARIALSVALLVPLGFALGMPLPAGIAALGKRRPEHLAWAWAINGATSVLGSVLAMLLALVVGFRLAVLAGAGCYLLALLVGVRLAAEPADRSAESLGDVSSAAATR